MNAPRRKSLQKIADSVHAVLDELESIKYEEEDSRDNIPENLQSTERYEKMCDACDFLDYAFSSLEEAVEYIESAIDI